MMQFGYSPFISWCVLFRQQMLLTVNDPAMPATDGVEMLSVFLQAAEFPDSDLFYRVLHYAGVDVRTALKTRQASCQLTASTAW